jgi:hypothetical protein
LISEGLSSRLPQLWFGDQEEGLREAPDRSVRFLTISDRSTLVNLRKSRLLRIKDRGALQLEAEGKVKAGEKLENKGQQNEKRGERIEKQGARLQKQGEKIENKSQTPDQKK